jgi:hypothetical protein
MKAYRGSRGTAPLILNLGTRWRWVVNFTPRPLYPRKEHWYPLHKRLSRPQSRSEHSDEEKNFNPLHVAHRRKFCRKPVFQPEKKKVYFSRNCILIIMYSLVLTERVRGSSVSIMTRLGIRRPRNCYSNPGRCNKFFSAASEPALGTT